MDSRTLRVLEFDKILERLAGTLLFRSAVSGRWRSPQPTISAWRASGRQRPREARRLLDEKSDIHLGGVHDLRPLVEQAAIGSTLLPVDLLTIRVHAGARPDARTHLGPAG